MEVQKENSLPQTGSPQWSLLNDFQRGFPICERPFQQLAAQLGQSEQWVLDQLQQWSDSKILSRVGPVFRPQALGASTLAAVQVGPDKIESVAKFINAFEEVNHNYLREGEFNLWFVITAASTQRLQDILQEIEKFASSEVIDCRLKREFRIDLGFELENSDDASAMDSGKEKVAFRSGPAQGAADLNERQTHLCTLLQDGLSLSERPFDSMAEKLNLPLEKVLKMVDGLIAQSVIRRFGLILRHRKLGYHNNAMTVWQIPEDKVEQVGHELTHYPFVTLCYERKTTKSWPYNLYCMIHGKTKQVVLDQIQRLADEVGLEEFPSRVLFSVHSYKQRGAKYLPQSTAHVDIDSVLIQRLQRGIDIVDRPYLSLAEELGISEEEICRRIQNMRDQGLLTRFGPMFNVEKLGGVFTLVAMEVPENKWSQTLKVVNAFEEVAHNYEREHKLNMWFVLATVPAADTEVVLQRIEEATGLKTYAMPKLKEFYLHLHLNSGGHSV